MVPTIFYDASYCEKSATFSSLGTQALYYFRQLSYVHQFQACEMTTETAIHFACKSCRLFVRRVRRITK
jgi:hypothetical protein